MRITVRTILVVTSLTAVAGLALLASSQNSAQAQSQSEPTVHVQAKHVQSIAQQAEVVRLRQDIRFYIRATSRLRAIAGRHTHSEHAERRTTSVAFLHWDKRLWHGRWLAAKQYVRDNPWIRMLRRTYAYRQCIIGHESKNAGVYKAENGGTRGVEGPENSDASGAYQFLNGTWQSQFANAKRYFKGKLKGRWYHAADAPPKVQDIVAAYDIAAAIQNHHATDWTYADCQAIGMSS